MDALKSAYGMGEIKIGTFVERPVLFLRIAHHPFMPVDDRSGVAGMN